MFIISVAEIVKIFNKSNHTLQTKYEVIIRIYAYNT